MNVEPRISKWTFSPVCVTKPHRKTAWNWQTRGLQSDIIGYGTFAIVLSAETVRATTAAGKQETSPNTPPQRVAIKIYANPNQRKNYAYLMNEYRAMHRLQYVLHHSKNMSPQQRRGSMFLSKLAFSDSSTVLATSHDKRNTAYFGLATTPVGRCNLSDAIYRNENAMWAFDKLEEDKHGKRLPVFSRGRAQRILGMILSALQFMHECGNLVHTDVKPSNIILIPHGKQSNWHNASVMVKIIDFGACSHIFRTTEGVGWNFKNGKTEVQDFQYRSPEMIAYPNDTRISHIERMDIWSVGCILYEMATQNKLFGRTTSASSSKTLFTEQLTLSPNPPGKTSRFMEQCSPEFQHLDRALKRRPCPKHLPLRYNWSLQMWYGMLQFDPATRWSASQCLQWIAKNRIR